MGSLHAWSLTHTFFKRPVRSRSENKTFITANAFASSGMGSGLSHDNSTDNFTYFPNSEHTFKTDWRLLVTMRASVLLPTKDRCKVAFFRSSDTVTESKQPACMLLKSFSKLSSCSFTSTILQGTRALPTLAVIRTLSSIDRAGLRTRGSSFTHAHTYRK